MRLTKHHGLGNDFLVLIDLEGARPITPADAVSLCDRRTGIGADGLLRLSGATSGADITMELLNADGSTAEMSGNGIRCLVQAALRADVVSGPTVRVATLAGLRTVTLIEEIDADTQRLQVEMGTAKVLDEAPEWCTGAARRARRVDVGNPHVVIEWAGALPTGAELVALGARIDDATPGGTNVELVQLAADGTLDMVVFERGVGPTQACGTGACATAAAASDWGLVGTSATVRMPGGPVDIELGDPVLLTGDAAFVAEILTPLA